MTLKNCLDKHWTNQEVFNADLSVKSTTTGVLSHLESIKIFFVFGQTSAADLTVDLVTVLSLAAPGSFIWGYSPVGLRAGLKAHIVVSRPKPW